MFNNDSGEAERDLESLIECYRHLSDARNAVLLDMRYQLGGAGLRKFARMLNALTLGDYDRAGAEIARFLTIEARPRIERGLIVTYSDAAAFLRAEVRRDALTPTGRLLLDDFVVKLAGQTDARAQKGLIDLTAPLELLALVDEAIAAANRVAAGDTVGR